MMVRNFLHGCGVLIALLLPLPSFADSAALRHSADKFMADYTRKLAQRLGDGTRIEYSLPSLDTRIGQADCSTPPALSVRDQGQTSARVNVLVSCSDGWSLYLPVDLTIFRQIVVANRPLAVGSTIGSDDVQLAEADVGQLLGQYITDPADAVGMGVKRGIGQGRPVVTQQLEAPLLIRRGDAVIISAESSAMAVKMPGIAMTDGRRGEQIRIKNQASSRIIDARVVGPGQAMVPM